VKGVEAGERHVPRADHQGHEVVGEAEHERHGDEEDHRRAVHGEDAVEGLRRDEVVVRADQLDPHDGRFDPADHQEEQRVDDVEQADALVIDGGHPLLEPVEERLRGGLGPGPI